MQFPYSFRQFLEAPFVSRLRSITGIDRAIFYTLVNRGWSVIAGPVSIFFVAHYLLPEEQGFYYTFGSILGLQVFFELGLAYVLMQCVSHEKATLDWTPEGTLTGDPLTKARLASMLRLALKWYGLVSLLALCTLIPAGYYFFGRNQPEHVSVSWHVPWFCVVGITVLNLLITPFYGVIEGCGRIADYARNAARQAIAGSITFWIALSFGSKLFAAPVLSLVSLIIGAFWVIHQYGSFFRDLLATPIPKSGQVKWRSEILPFQWKIALSWLSGYFIFQLANPIMFHYHGAAAAGQMGMTVRIVDTITALGLAWVSTKSAPFGGYIAKKDYATLDTVFRGAFLQSVGVVLFGGAAFLALYLMLRAAHFQVVDRLLPPLPIGFLLATAVINCIVFNQAIYLRAHKEDPFLINSLIGALLVPTIMYTLGRPYGALGISAGLFFGSLFIGLPLATTIFLKKKRAWHFPPNT